ncbi:GreA/GreB family elongation factor [Piscinibacter gummiphilus]|uniref:GreA/GreB family elongation factor n=1 Tax=Piscinibacter gummiphilus TaxID=946333 RepID=A0ABZ0CM32_9BURK|nr:GreA/GreB family elongation factor [Piscinibacter gummiphilus]WOB06040.1 GreA/GreB family elongation factor [Piscinibacter gummiphilus]
MEVLTERTLTELDHIRLARLTLPSGDEGLIDELLDSAELVSSRAVSPDVVTMYSQVELADLATGHRQRLTVCYPHDAEPSAGFVSVLSPVGASLIGRRVGSIARWQTPHGDEGAAEVVALLFQPEASGDYTT